MTQKVVKPIALDESFRTTEQNPQNIADVLANKLDAIKSAIENGGSDEMEAAFECHYNVTSATDIYNAMQEKKVPFFYQNGVVAQLWKVETNKYTFRTTRTRAVEGENILDIVDYIVNGSVWSTATKTISGGSSSQQAYLAKVESSVNFDTTGLSGMKSIISVNDVPADGVYQLSIFMCITPKTASATKSDLVFQFTGTSGTGMPNTTFHAVVDDSQTFAQQLSFSTTLNLKAGTSSLKMQCGGLNTEYLVFVDDLTVAGLIVGSPEPTPVVTSGANIYLTLQDAITDATNLSVGDIFETNGFHTNGDGGAARYLVSDTGTANGYNIIELSAGKYAILQVHDFIHPECYGAKGDNSTDNTAVFDVIFSDANVKSIMLSANKTYKIQFKNWTLRNITLVGADKMSSRLSQMNTNLNKPFATIAIGVEIGNICFICGGGNTQQTGLFHFGNDENGTFQPFTGSIIHDIYAYCVQNIIGFDFSYTQSGSHTIRIERCKLDSPGIGVRVTNLNDLTHLSYLSNFYFNDIIVTGPYDYGFSFDKSQAGGMMISHGLLTQCSVQLSRNGSCGYKLSYGDYTILNPCVFVENPSGEVFSVELDLDKLYVSVVPNGILNVIGGILEGTIKNKEFLHSINWKGVDFVEEKNFPEGISGHRAYSRHLNTTPNSIFTKSFSDIKNEITLTNGTSLEDRGIYGKTIKVAVTDFGLSQVTIKIPIDLPDVEKLTSIFLFELSNGYKFLTSGSLPSVALKNSSDESILDALGPDPNGKRNRITMDDLEKYYALVGTFDISEADRTKTWYLQVNIPTSFSTSVENAYISILGINLYEDYVKPADISISKVNSIYWNL